MLENSMTPTKEEKQPLFLRAAWGENTARTPLWIMRQAGRYLPEYRALREKHSFLEMCHQPELAVEVTLQPIRRFGMDAAILFSDIMTPLEAMGVGIDFAPGPVIAHPVREKADVDRLRIPEEDEITPYVMDAIRMLRRELSVPLIGFGGAPLTLATYLVQGQGSKDYEWLRMLLRKTPEVAHALLDALAEVSIRYLRAQIKAGAQAIQLFDSWAGLHDAQIYREFGAHYAEKVLRGIDGMGVPRIYIAVNAFHLLPEIQKLPAEVVSVDWRQPLQVAREFLPGKTLQGNLDPAVLLAGHDVIEREATRVLESGCGGAHIFNLGHGIIRHTPPENLQKLVDVVRGFERLGPSS